MISKLLLSLLYKLPDPYSNRFTDWRNRGWFQRQRVRIWYWYSEAFDELEFLLGDPIQWWIETKHSLMFRLNERFHCRTKGHGDFYPDHCFRKEHDICKKCQLSRDVILMRGDKIALDDWRTNFDTKKENK